MLSSQEVGTAFISVITRTSRVLDSKCILAEKECQLQVEDHRHLEVGKNE